MKQKNILFICKHNIFRSRVAEEYLKKINKKVNVTSAGTILGEYTPKTTSQAAKEFDLDITYNPKPLTMQHLKEQDIVVVVASDVPKTLFDSPLYETNDKLQWWNIDDVTDLFNPGLENNKEIIEEIIQKVDTLNNELQKNNGIE